MVKIPQRKIKKINMNIFNRNKTLVTHNNTFHADDIFATAVLSMVCEGKVKIIRTRDEEVIKKGDYVYDVGGVYDEATDRFDHHQAGGAGVRPNGIPYASLGLVWKKYGDQICGSPAVAYQLDKKLVQPIDANDNGVDLIDLKTEVAPYLIQDLFFLFRPSYKEVQEYDEPFMKLVDLATEILIREIKKMTDALEAEDIVVAAYQNALDKRIVVLDGYYPWGEILSLYNEPLYVVFPKNGTWRVECVRKEKKSFENRKPLPESWAGQRDADLVKVTGVLDATFCHNARFLIVAKSRDGALALAEKALLA